MSLHQTTRLQRDNGVCFISEAEKERPLTIVDAVVWSWWLDAEGGLCKFWVLQQYTLRSCCSSTVGVGGLCWHNFEHNK